MLQVVNMFVLQPICNVSGQFMHSSKLLNKDIRAPSSTMDSMLAKSSSSVNYTRQSHTSGVEKGRLRLNLARVLCLLPWLLLFSDCKWVVKLEEEYIVCSYFVQTLIIPYNPLYALGKSLAIHVWGLGKAWVFQGLYSSRNKVQPLEIATSGAQIPQTTS